MAAAGTEISNNLGVDGNKQGGIEVKNGLVTLQATLAVKDGKIDAEKAKQAVIVVIAETLANGQGSTKIENYSSNKSNSKLSDYETNNNRDIVLILLKDKIDNITKTDAILKPSKII